MTEPFPPHPRVTETMAVVNHALEQYDRLIEAYNTNSTTGTDATKTVAVTVNHFRWLTDVWIAPGTRSVGAAELNARIREALNNANTLAQQSADAVAADHQLELNGVLDSLRAVVAKYEGSPQTAPAAAPVTNDRW